MRKSLTAFALLSFVAIAGYWGTSGRASSPASVVTQYVKALQAHDTKTLVTLTRDTQREISDIKARNPQALWPKLIDQYHAAMLMGTEMNFDYKTLALFPPGASWKIMESRAEHNEWVNVTVVSVAVTYPKLEDSPYLDGHLLQQAVVRFTLAAPLHLVQEAVRLPHDDVSRTAVPLMVFSAAWGTSDFGLKLSAAAVGGTPPFVWSAECGGVTFPSQNRNVWGVMQPGENEALYQTTGLPKFDAEPVHCVMTVTDAAGTVDHGQFTVPEIATRAMHFYCFERTPWVTREVVAGEMCIGKRLPITQPETAAGSR